MNQNFCILRAGVATLRPSADGLDIAAEALSFAIGDGFRDGEP